MNKKEEKELKELLQTIEKAYKEGRTQIVYIDYPEREGMFVCNYGINSVDEFTLAIANLIDGVLKSAVSEEEYSYSASLILELLQAGFESKTNKNKH